MAGGGKLELTSKRIVVTGGSGFLGKFIVAKLKEKGCEKIFVPRSKDYDLRDAAAVAKMYNDFMPDVVIHNAARVGGIGANRAYPGKFFYDNAIMGVHLIEQGRLHNIEKFVQIGTICSYPKYTPVPFKEEDLWEGYPEETSAPYGLAKKMLLVQLQAYRQEYGLKGICLLLVNLYGPGDKFDLESSHVIPAMIRKFLDAKLKGEEEVVLWGDGSPTREFLYVEDAAEGLKYFKVNFAHRIQKEINFDLGVKEIFCVMINTNRYNSHPLELYGERLKAIRWFEENHPDDFRLYGRGWVHEEYPSYRGEVAFKKDVLKKAKFSICYENARDIPGYITEKIFDCFIYGCVPIYLGAPNVTEHIPAATFIDKRNFKSYPELSKYLRDMPPQEYIGYLEAIKSFLESEKSYPFSVEYFIDLMANKILNVD